MFKRFDMTCMTRKMYELRDCLKGCVLRPCSNISVFISESNNIYTNLALEEWFYRNEDFKNKYMLMMWSNDPCVVIGKFQNPWMEANVSKLDTILPDGIKLARRNSGGGTVYHDRGNLNLTFFTPRIDYNRRNNLEIIKRAIFKDYGLKINISPREDLMVGDCKVSGTASKLGRLVAYHHCTLLVNVNKHNLRESLKQPNYDIKTNATKSIKAEILNLSDINSNVTVENLMVSVGEEYLRTEHSSEVSPLELNNSDMTPHLLQRVVEQVTDDKYITKFHILRPTEDELPGLTDIRDNMADWNWNFGKCPNFTATKEYMLLTINIAVEYGCVIEISVVGHNSNTNVLLTNEFRSRKFGEYLFKEVHECIQNLKSYNREIM